GLYVASNTGDLAVLGMSAPDAPGLSQTLRLTDSGQKLTAMSLLAGGISLITGSDNGEIEQWFMVRNDQNKDELTLIRDFDPLGNQAIEHIVPEYGRRGFIVSDTAGNIGVYYSTSGRQVLETQVRDGAISELAVSPRSDLLIVNTDNGKVHGFNLHNEHPEISWSSLWGKVWYESYTEPQFVWQSSSASNDFEPKFSLVPLSFGTLKAAFYAMLFAMPLAIMGAIYTAYFMAPDLRRMVKPTVEVMEALPTVILGFLAGLWLAPVVENNLPGIFSMLLLLPFGVIVFAYGWSRTPYSVRRWVPEGWQPALLVPAIVVFATIALLLSKPLELWLFGGNMPLWLDQELGISYDQRNALVVGLAMGFAVIPTIFSIAEDAIFSVPKQLSNGSLALGATPWQTLVRVVLPTASPGIFSSVMIGMGRAVGETMIVLMATGNTPVMDGSPFQGMRTLSANIAVEMPESEVGSTHFRILFLAGLVLFMFTFIFNTVAELVRQRLREKYSNL
ncbi:MAG: ABC transporter permease subunit, partial [Salinisphaeraceae bacterium]|nr:ABC transporter permease subunit [Salinisphaeraceae bacterium]